MNRIKELRQEAGLKQIDLARYSGITKTIISNLEIGRQKLREPHQRALCYFFQVTADYLLGLSPVGKKVHFADEGKSDGLYVGDGEISSERMEISIVGNGTVHEEDLFGMGRKEVMEGPYVCRFVKGFKGEMEAKKAIIRAIDERLERLSQDDCDKVLRFIDDYM